MTIPLRQVRERELVLATRALFDERGMQDAPIEEVARAVGIARGLVYRHFSSKEELFVLTVTEYLAELAGVLRDAIAGADEPEARLRRCAEAYTRFCLRYPAFLDCALSLMKRPARELYEILSESVWLRLGQGMTSCTDQFAGLLREGTQTGAWTVENPEYLAHVLWTQVLGAMHLARIGVGVRELAPGVPTMFSVAPEDVARTCVESAIATVRG